MTITKNKETGLYQVGEFVMKTFLLGSIFVCLCFAAFNIIKVFFALELTQGQMYGIGFVALSSYAVAYFAKMIWDEI